MSRKKSKKTNPRRIPATMADIKKYARQFEEELEQTKTEAAREGTIWVQAIFFMSLHNAFGFGVKRFIRLQEEADRISDRIADPEDPYTFDTLLADLEAIDVSITRDEENGD